MIEVDIQKKLGAFQLNVRFKADAETLGLLGASGCGKSMTLKCIAGIEKPDAGRIVIDGEPVFDAKKGINLPPQRRGVGYLFQQYALFPTLTVYQNLDIVLPKAMQFSQRRERIAEMIQRLRLQGLDKHKPAQLSGGQQQRTAIARMLLTTPRIIMLDEPLSALDSYLRLGVETELQSILRDFAGTILYVTHNRDEIYRVCSNIVILDEGRVVDGGSAEMLFRSPRTVATARLTGVKNVAPATVVDASHVFVPQWGVTLEIQGPIPLNFTHVGIRGHHICVAADSATENCFEFKVTRRQSAPFEILECLRVPSQTLDPATTLVRITSGQQDPVYSWDPVERSARMQLPKSRILLLSSAH